MDLTTMNATDLRTQAAACRQRRMESQDRSDTDGFLTQWASGLQANLLEEQAKIVENGGRGSFCGLYEGDRRLMAKLIHTQFGPSWLLHDDEAAVFGRRFIPATEKSRVRAKLGLRERPENAPAWAKLDGAGRGLSGTCYVSVYRTGCQWGQDAVCSGDYTRD